MAYDGIFIKSQISEIKALILNNHINKITQTGKYEINFHIKQNGKFFVLTLSAFKSFPHIKINTSSNTLNEGLKTFGMILKKYLHSGEFINIEQICLENVETLERNIDFTIKNLNDKGEYENFHLIFELMGRYNNIILTNSNYTIIDTFYKDNDNILNDRLKTDTVYKPLYSINKVNFNFKNNNSNVEALIKTRSYYEINNENFDLIKIFLNTFYGFSKTFLFDIFNNFNLDINDFSLLDNEKIYDVLNKIKQNIINAISGPIPTLYFDNEVCKDFHVLDLNTYNKKTRCKTINELINSYIKSKFENLDNNNQYIKEKILDQIEKYNKKLEFANASIEKSKNYEIYKKYGELILTYGYNAINIKSDFLYCKDIDGTDFKIQIDLTKSINENATEYFKKYKKFKKTVEVSNEIIKDATNSIEHLSEILDMLNISKEKGDLFFIKEELNKFFNVFPKQKNIIKNSKKNNFNIHKFISSDGIKIFVGKNNIQNEYLTFDFAKPTDTWFHIKNTHGAHVIVDEHIDKLPVRTIEEAAELAGYFSNNNNENKVAVDYTLKKYLKKVKGKPPGFCIYQKYKTIVVKPQLSLKEII